MIHSCNPALLYYTYVFFTQERDTLEMAVVTTI